jgi:hypothetical protein
LLYAYRILVQKPAGETLISGWENSKMNPMETDFEDGRWMEIAHDSVQWHAFIVLLNLWVMLPECLITI